MTDGANGVAAYAPTRDAALAHAKRSPEVVAIHDRAAWRALFQDGAIVEDPVGTPACTKGGPTDGRGRDTLDRFWDTFIGPNAIRFEEHLDAVVGRFVARDVTIHTRMATGFENGVDVHLLYELAEGPNGPLIHHLAAHWEGGEASRRYMAGGLRGYATIALSSVRLLKELGLDGAKAYNAGMSRGLKRAGREALLALGEAIDARDVAAIDALFEGAPHLAWGDDEFGDAASFLDALGDEGLRVHTPRASGYSVSGRFARGGADGGREGLVFATGDRATKKLVSARFIAE